MSGTLEKIGGVNYFEENGIRPEGVKFLPQKIKVDGGNVWVFAKRARPERALNAYLASVMAAHVGAKAERIDLLPLGNAVRNTESPEKNIGVHSIVPTADVTTALEVGGGFAAAVAANSPAGNATLAVALLGTLAYDAHPGNFGLVNGQPDSLYAFDLGESFYDGYADAIARGKSFKDVLGSNPRVYDALKALLANSDPAALETAATKMLALSDDELSQIAAAGNEKLGASALAGVDVSKLVERAKLGRDSVLIGLVEMVPDFADKFSTEMVARLQQAAGLPQSRADAYAAAQKEAMAQVVRPASTAPAAGPSEYELARAAEKARLAAMTQAARRRDQSDQMDYFDYLVRGSEPGTSRIDYQNPPAEIAAVVQAISTVNDEHAERMAGFGKKYGVKGKLGDNFYGVDEARKNPSLLAIQQTAEGTYEVYAPGARGVSLFSLEHIEGSTFTMTVTAPWNYAGYNQFKDKRPAPMTVDVNSAEFAAALKKGAFNQVYGLDPESNRIEHILCEDAYGRIFGKDMWAALDQAPKPPARPAQGPGADGLEEEITNG